MAGIGEASAVIAVVQSGFSLAKALNTYIGDYKDSYESVTGLASELDATITQIKELSDLVAYNDAAGPGSLKLCEKCTEDSNRLIRKIVELLTKARLPEDPTAMVNLKDNIRIRTFDRARWPLYKSKVDSVKSELHLMKTDILIARSCIQAQSGVTSAEKTQNEKNIVAYARSRQQAERVLHRYQRKELRLEEEVFHMAAPQGNSTSYRTVDFGRGPGMKPKGSVVDSPGGYRAHQPATRNAPIRSSARERNSALENAETEQLASDFRDWEEKVRMEVKQEEARKRKKADDDKEANRLAVANYQESVRAKLAELDANAKITEQQFNQVFGEHLDKNQVQQFLKLQREQQMEDELSETLLQLVVGEGKAQKTLDEGVSGNDSGIVPIPKKR